MNEELFTTAGKFLGKEKIEKIEEYGNGHINDTYLVTLKNGGLKILQHLNTGIFKNPEGVMNNIEAVTEYIKNEIRKNGGDENRETMTVVDTVDGSNHYIDETGKFWRMYDFVSGSKCYQTVECPEDFYKCAYAFGNFQRLLKSFPADSLCDTIPDFHNTAKRFENFKNAVCKDICGRAKDVKKEIDFIFAREEFTRLFNDRFKNGILPLKVTHNDTKLNNILFDEKSGDALCIIDLDTIMPGFSVNDFGDSIRFGASTAPEDEKDLDKVSVDIDLFKCYTEGFLSGCAGTLTDGEIDLLPEGAKMMTLEVGMRFLTDYLEGDTYFKVHYDGQNLDRCRTQLKLVADMEAKWDEMKSIVKIAAYGK